MIETYISYTIGLAGIILTLVGIYLTIKARAKKNPQCRYKTYREIQKLTSHNESPIKILYHSQEVDRVYTTYVWFWNRGATPILRSDLQTHSSLNLVMKDENPDFVILDHKVTKTTRSDIRFAAKKTSNQTLSIKFNFLDHNDGALIQIQHNGGKESEIIIQGVILGTPRGVTTKKLIRETSRVQTNTETILEWTQVIVLIALAFALLGLLANPQLMEQPLIETQPSLSTDRLADSVVAQFPNATEEQIEAIVSESARTLGPWETILVRVLHIIGFFLLTILLIAKISTIRRPFPALLLLKEEDKRLTKLERASNKLEQEDIFKYIEGQVITNEKEQVVFEQTYRVKMSAQDIYKHREDLFESEEEVTQIQQELTNQIQKITGVGSLLGFILSLLQPRRHK